MNHNYPESQIDEILRVPPAKLTAYSTIFISIGLMVFFAIGMLVSIPEESGGNVRLFNNHAYVNIYSATGGRVAKLFVKDKAPVNKGDFLVLIDNPVEFQEYQSLIVALEQFDSIFGCSDTLTLASTNMPGLNRMGNMQSTYQELQKQLQQFSTYILSNEYSQQCFAIQSKQHIYLTYTGRLAVQEKLLDRSVGMKVKNLERNKHLHNSGLISDADLERIEAEALDEEMKLETVKTNILENELKIHECSKQLMELSWQYRNERDEQFLGVVSIHKQLQELLQLWEEKYLVRAPVSGIVQLTDLWEEQQQLNTEEVIMTILPSNDLLVLVKMHCPAGEAVKVKYGNEVLIEVQGFPAMTHGYIRGNVENISEVPVGGMYTVDITLTGGLTTTLGKTLQFNRYAEGHGKIITGKKTFLAHLVKNILVHN